METNKATDPNAGQISMDASAMSFDVDDLANFDLTDVKARSMTGTPAGRFHVVLREALLEPREDKDGNTVACVRTKWEILSVADLVKTEDEDGKEIDPNDFVGQTILKTFWSIKEYKQIEYLVGFLSAVMGEKVTGQLAKILSVMEQNDIQCILTVVERPNKDDPSSPYTDVKEQPKFITSYNALTEAGALLPVPEAA